MQGHSLLPLVEGRRDGWRDEVYIHMSEFMTGRDSAHAAMDLRRCRA